MKYIPNKNGFYQVERDSITVADAIIYGIAAICFAVGFYGLTVILFTF